MTQIEDKIKEKMFMNWCFVAKEKQKNSVNKVLLEQHCYNCLKRILSEQNKAISKVQ